MEVLLIAIAGTLNIACFLIGAKVGQMSKRDETIIIPEVNPMKKYQEYRENKEAKRKQERMDAILRNIDNYNGTGIGQVDVPK